jgi:hypothetical protein
MSFGLFKSTLLLLATLKVNIVFDGNVSIFIIVSTIALLPIFARELRSSAALVLAYWFVIALHQGIAFTNFFFFVTPGAGGEAILFHENSASLAESLQFFTTNVYSEVVERVFFCSLLGLAYLVFEPTMLVGSQITILVFAISCIIIIKILGLLELSRYRVPVLLVFGSLPSMVLMGSVPLRESYQILFLMLTIYFGIKMNLKGSVKGYFLFMVGSALFMGLLHHGLNYYAKVLIIFFLVWTPYVCSSLLSIKKRQFISVIAVLTLLVTAFFLVRVRHVNIGFISQLFDMNWDVIKVFRDNSGLVMGRTSYEVVLDFSSIFTTIKTFFLLYTHYLFAPFPWQVKSFLDYFAFFESFLRMVFICFSVKYWLSSNGQKRRMLGLMLILYFSVSFMYALGTTNYGTAIRHHMLSWWILAITGTPLLIDRWPNSLKFFSIPRSYIPRETKLTP